jgi:hypothetical protein
MSHPLTDDARNRLRHYLHSEYDSGTRDDLGVAQVMASLAVVTELREVRLLSAAALFEYTKERQGGWTVEYAGLRRWGVSKAAAAREMTLELREIWDKEWH